MRRISLLLVLLVCPSSAWAFWGVGDVVFDPSVWAEAFATAGSTAKTATDMAQQVRQTAQDLAPLTSFPVDGIMESLDIIVRVTRDVKGLIPFDADIGAVGAAFDSIFPSGDRLPCTTEERSVWKARAMIHLQGAVRDSHTAGGLLHQFTTAVFRFGAMLTQLQHILGSVAGVQMLGQYQGLIFETQNRLGAIQAMFDRTLASKEAVAVTEEAIAQCMQAKRVEKLRRRYDGAGLIPMGVR